MKTYPAFALATATAAAAFANTPPAPTDAASSVASSRQSLVLRLEAASGVAAGAQDWRLFSTVASVGTCGLNCREPKGTVCIVR